MSSRKLRYLCLGVFVVCAAVLVVLTVNGFRSRAVIGGADWPTLMYCVRKTALSPAGIAAEAVGGLALAAAIAVTRMKK